MSEKLTTIQKEAFERFKKLKVGALFMKMGTGKTRVAMELVNYNEPDYLLYITPFSTIENARAEIEKWGCCCVYDILGYESIASSDKIYADLHKKVEDLKKENKKMFIIADESIFIKNGISKRTRRCKELRRFFDYALILNGTPVTKNEWDLFNQMDFLSNKILNMNYKEFIKLFFVEHKGNRYNGDKPYHTFYEPNRPALVKLCEPYIYEADLQFNLKEDTAIDWISIDKTEYNSNINNILEDYRDYSIDTLLNLFSALQRVAACNKEKNTAVAEYISGRQCICFCNYIDEIKEIQKKCDCYVLTGETKEKERKKIIENFKNDGNKPLVIMMGCGAFGLNLQFCNEIVYSSLTFDFAKLEQSEYRIKRTGQTRDIQYTYILADVNINHMMFENIDKKQNLLDIIKNLLKDSREGK